MLTEYIRAALHQAQYEKLEDSTYYGEIPGLQGVYAGAATLELCREELQSALEDWILFGIANGFHIPPINGIDLNGTKVA
ncbi:MAG TPA: type II toxin-antitoxin system HicB family antitoxin [Chloroflexota bacterium]